MDEIANELLAEFANEACKQQTTDLQASSLRWQIADDRYPPAVVILMRGKERKTVATISPTSPFAHLYPSWQPVIKALKNFTPPYICFEQKNDYRKGDFIVNYLNKKTPGQAHFQVTSLPCGVCLCGITLRDKL